MLLLLSACALPTRPSPELAVAEATVDTVADAPIDTDTDADTDSGGTGISLQIGDACDPDTSDCGPGAGCCTECCGVGAEPTCTLLDDAGRCPLPDLTMDPGALGAAVDVQDMPFEADSCAIAEGCVDGPGTRRLLKFTTTIPNTGSADLYFGNVIDDDRFHYDSCHEHMHFDTFAEYALYDADGVEVATGRKQAFCLADNTDWGGGGLARYTCDFQGISVGWADTYASWLDCQWIDITEVPAGDYLLRVTVNPVGLIAESDYGNNVAEVAVTVIARDAQPPITEPCATNAYGEYRDCGWEAFGTMTCTPGATVAVGCDPECLGACEGDPVLRVCDGAATTCRAIDALASADRAECGSWCPRTDVVCPTSGMLQVYTGGWTAGEAAACAVELTEG